MRLMFSLKRVIRPHVTNLIDRVFYMGFSIGLVGLPNAGKSTIFNALSAAGAQTASYAFTTIDPNKSRVPVPDERLKAISGIIKPPKTTPTVLECIDIAGLVEGASKGEGLGNKFLENIRTVDCIAHILRCYRDENIPHESGSIDPLKDLELIETELLLADLEVCSKRLERTEKALRTGDKKLKAECEFLTKMVGDLEEGKPAGKTKQSEDERKILLEMNLLSSKPAIYIGNCRESGDKDLIEKAKTAARNRGSEIIVIDGLIESELSDLDETEKTQMLKGYGYERTGLEKMLTKGYRVLDLITFYTIKGDETRAWTLKKGQSALDGAAKIHTDMAKGFIKAEVAHYEDFAKLGSMDALKQEGLLEIAGKEYPVRDGDMILFKFRA